MKAIIKCARKIVLMLSLSALVIECVSEEYFEEKMHKVNLSIAKILNSKLLKEAS